MTDEQKIAKDIEMKQLVEAISTFRIQLSTITQALTVLIAGNITVLGWAISSQKIGLIFVSSLFPLFALFLKRIFARISLPILYTAFVIEKELNCNIQDLLITTYMGTRQGNAAKEFEEISKYKEQRTRFELIAKYSNRTSHMYSGTSGRIIIFTFLLEIVFGLILMANPKWIFF